MQSDLRNASQQIDMYKVENSQYPTSTSELNSGNGLKLSPSNSLLSYTYDDAANYYCLTIKSGTIVTSIKNNASIANGYCMRNLVKNGDFSNGIMNWNTKYIGGTLSVVGGVGQHVSDGTDAAQRIWQNIATTINANHQVYTRIDFKTVSYPALTMFGIGCLYQLDTGYATCMSQGNGIAYAQNVWNYIGKTYLPYGPQDFFEFNTYKTGHPIIPSGTISQFDNIVLIDLTATFGAGNEPTQAAMDTMLAKYPTKWFEGAVIVNK